MAGDAGQRRGMQRGETRPVSWRKQVLGRPTFHQRELYFGLRVAARRRNLLDRMTVVTGDSFPAHLSAQFKIPHQNSHRGVTGEAILTCLNAEIRLGSLQSILKKPTLHRGRMSRSLPPVKDGAMAVAAQLCAAGRFQINGQSCRAVEHEQSACYYAHRSPPDKFHPSMHHSLRVGRTTPLTPPTGVLPGNPVAKTFAFDAASAMQWRAEGR